MGAMLKGGEGDFQRESLEEAKEAAGRHQEPGGGGTESALQMPRAVHFFTSPCLGMGASFPFDGLIQISCLPPWKLKWHP
jgi:hypothetical protein